jgi:transcription initiation factor TFIID TATA-box-binding protein
VNRRMQPSMMDGDDLARATALLDNTPACVAHVPHRVLRAAMGFGPEESTEDIEERLSSASHPSAGMAPDLSPPPWILQNVVARFECGLTVSPRDLAMKYCNTEWTPQHHSRVYIRMREPAKATCLVWSSGRVVLMGAKSVQGAKAVAKRCAQLLLATYPEARFRHYAVTNLVALLDARFPIDLEQMHTSLPAVQSRYHPEIFGALFYSMTDPKLTAMVFANGRVGMTGARTVGDLDRAAAALWPLLHRHRFRGPELMAPVAQPESDPETWLMSEDWPDLTMSEAVPDLLEGLLAP